MTLRMSLQWFAAALALLCAACADTVSVEEPSAAPRPVTLMVAQAARTTREQIAEVNFGALAHFSVCVQPLCPKVTPKTVSAASVSENTPTAPTLSNSDATASPPLVVYFRSGSAQLDADGRARIRASVDSAAEAAVIVLAARTDNAGPADLNAELARARAQAVGEYYRTVSPALGASFEVDAQPQCCYAATNVDSSGRARNRRVEVSFRKTRSS
jgi:outer membrane protein OmpA-like peptidoglycan-associated protein